MTVAEIKELMLRRKWSRAKLASELDLTENAVIRWLKESRCPAGPASVLMRMWLEDARKQAVEEFVRERPPQEAAP